MIHFNKLMTFMLTHIILLLIISSSSILLAAPFLPSDNPTHETQITSDNNKPTNTNNNSQDSIIEAIKICRQKLEQDPFFPKVQYSLAQLLDSKTFVTHDEIVSLSDNYTNNKSTTTNMLTNDDIHEVINLYLAVGNPPLPQTPTNRIPPLSIRLKAICRAATISHQVLSDIPLAITCFTSALHLLNAAQNINDDNTIQNNNDIFKQRILELKDEFLLAFEQVIKLILSTIIMEQPIIEQTQSPQLKNVHISVLGSTNSHSSPIMNHHPLGEQCKQQQRDNYLQTGLTLCDLIVKTFSNETIADEYKGAILRKMKQHEKAFESYYTAMVKSKTLYFDSSCNCNDDNHHENLIVIESQAQINNSDDNNRCYNLLFNYIRIAILASAAGRELQTGIMTNFDEPMKYLLDAEEALNRCRALQYDDNDDNDDNDATNQRIDLNRIQEYHEDIIIDLFNNMGIIEKKRRDYPKAKEFFRKALNIKANDGHALVQLASIQDINDINSGNNDDHDNEILANVKELDPDYVGALFDGYSSRFESELVGVLQYQGHILVYNSIKEISSSSSLSISRVIDLGCGTGLLGEMFINDLPSIEIHGVDLSQRMVQISKDRRSKKNGQKVYSIVVNEDAAHYLSSLQPQSIDCIVASDVFIYVGDISKVLEASISCLNKNGLFGFTVESYHNQNDASDNSMHDGNNDNESGIKLLSSGRFGHSKAYIYRIAELYRFDVVLWRDCVLRKQAGLDVRGAVVVLQVRS